MFENVFFFKFPKRAHTKLQYKNELRKMHNRLLDGTVEIQNAQVLCDQQLVEINDYIGSVEEPTVTVVVGVNSFETNLISMKDL